MQGLREFSSFHLEVLVGSNLLPLTLAEKNTSSMPVGLLPEWLFSSSVGKTGVGGGHRASRFATQPLQMNEGSQPFRERAAMSLRLDWVAQLVQTAPLQELLGEPGEPVESPALTEECLDLYCLYKAISCYKGCWWICCSLQMLLWVGSGFRPHLPGD